MACFTGKKSLRCVCVCVCVCVRQGGLRWWARVESQQRQWRDEEGGIEDGGVGENWAVVMDATQGSGTLGLSVIKGLLFSQRQTLTHTPAFPYLRSD